MSAIAVCGLGRCGSSLMMQMLAAGGVPCAGSFPDFEEDWTLPGSFTAARLTRTVGAVKILDPHRHSASIFDAENLSIIWLSRSIDQQAASSAKFLELVGGFPHFARAEVRKLAARMRGDTRRSLSILAKCRPPMLALTFEELVVAPEATCCRVADFIRPNFTADPSVMASAFRYRGPRPTACLPYMLEAEILAGAA